MTSFFKWQCVAALHSDRVSLCIYWAACLQTVWLSGCLHHHSLPRIDPPTALLLSALLCCIDVFSNDFHTHCAQIFVLLSARTQTDILKTLSHNQHSALTNFCQAYIQFKDSYRYLIMSLTLLLYSCSPSWVVSDCLGQMNQTKLTSGSREKDRKGGIYGTEAIIRREGPSAELIYAGLCVFACLCMCVISLFRLVFFL